MSKRILSMLLAIVMVVGMMHGMSITANAAEILVQGNWSNGVNYKLYDDGKMIISGDGSIPSNAFYKPGYGSSPTGNDTIEKVKENLEVLEIGDGITSIESNAFRGCSKLTQITIKGAFSAPMYSDDIGRKAFSDCSALTTIYYYGEDAVSGGSASLGNNVRVHVLADYPGNSFANLYNNQFSTKIIKDLTKEIDAKDAVINLKEEYTYTGKAITPVIVTLDGNTLVEDTDYEVSYKDNVNVGTATVTVTFKGNYTGDAKTASFKIVPADVPSNAITAPTAKTLTYTGMAQKLINAGSVAVGYGTMEYKLGEDGTWGTEVPEAKNAGIYKVYYKVVGDKNYNGFEAEEPVTVEIKKADSSVTAPEAKKDLSYNGSNQALVTEGEAAGGTLQYSLDKETWSTEVPTAMDAATYKVYYKVVGDKNHNDFEEEEPVTVEIKKASSSITTAPTAVELTYNGASQTLLATKGTAEGGTIMYSLNAEGSWLDTIPRKTNAGEYTVWYKVAGDNNHNDTTAQSIPVEILQAQVKLGISTSATSALPGNKIAVAVTYDNDLAGASIALENDEQFTVDTDSKKVEEGKVTFIITLDNDLVVGKNEVEVEAIVANDNFMVVEPAIAKVKIGVTDNSGEIDDLNEQITALQQEINKLKEQIAGDTSVSELAVKLAGILERIEELEELNGANHATKDELRTVKESLEGAIAALAARVASLEEGLAEANGKINTNSTDIATLQTGVAALVTWKAEAVGAIGALETLTQTQGTEITALKTAVASLQTALARANENITAAEERIATLEGKVGALETAKENLEKAVDDLQKAIAQKADTATVNAKVEELTTAINNAKTAAEAFATAADAALKTELLNSIDTAKAAAIAAANEALNTAKTELNAAIAQKADAATVNAKVEELNAAINNAKTAAEAFATAADATLKEELLSNIVTAKNEAIAAADAALEEAKTALNAAIDKKADTATVNAKVAALTTAIANAEKAAKDYADVKDAALKEALEAKLTEANALINSLDSRMDTAEEAIAKLENAIKDLEQADAENEAAMKAAIETLNKAIADAKAFAEKSDADLKNALNEKINAAQTALEAKIAEIQANLDKAVEELKAADQANAEKLADAIARLKEAIAVAEAASAATDAVQDEHIIALKNEINRVAIDLEKAQANLEAALKAEIEALTSELKRAEEALKNAIDTKADEDAVNAAIAELQNEIAALEAAKNNYIAADAALKAEVEAAIAKAKQEAIEAAKGHIPYLGENGNWWIGNSDTGVDANGIQGETGKDGITPKLRVGSGNIWEVSYDNGKTWTSLGVSAVGASGSNGRNGRDGKDGVDGKDGITPQLRINEDTNMWEISYDEGKTWESLGVVATGADGVDGANGADGITPQLRINEKTNMWEVSYDEGATWTSMGVKATGADGSSNVLPLVISGISLAGMIAMLCIMLADRKKRGLPVG